MMTGEDTDVKAIQFRGSDETLAGSFQKNHVRIADDRTPEPRRGRQNTKRDERTTRIVPRIVVAEQWLCFLLGLICMICGVCGLFMKYNQDSPFAYSRWLAPTKHAIAVDRNISPSAGNWALARLGRSAEDNGKLLHDHVKTK
ncbi:MAG: hypothetical protein JWQ42_254 [Edaphobacter sp.]|nr:hypothetical protein [Edaphobacter sp.]